MKKKEKIFADIMKRAKKKSFNYKIKRASKIAAILILTIGILGVAGFYSTSEAFRVNILDLIFHSNDRYDEIETINREYPGEENNNWNDDEINNMNEQFVLQFGYVPDGYKLEQNDSSSLRYRKDEYTYVSLDYIVEGSQAQINNENLTSERIYRNGYEVELRYRNTFNLAIWQYKGKTFALYAVAMDRDTFFKVFDSLHEAKDK